MNTDRQTTPLQLIAAEAMSESAPPDRVLKLDNEADPLKAPLTGVERIELHFPAFTDGRAFSQAWLLRRRRGFTGDIRATGEVLVDQLQQMARCGFSSAVLAPGQDIAAARRQLARYEDFYQGDALRPLPRFRRVGARG